MNQASEESTETRRMKRKRVWRWIRRILVLGVLAALVWVAYFGYRAAPITTGYASKILCSGVFVSQRPQADVIDQDLEWFPYLDLEVNETRGTASASLWGWFRREALYREGLGCTLLIKVTADELRQQAANFTPGRSRPAAAEAWPRGEDVRLQDLNPALQDLVDESLDESGMENPVRTRALVIVHQGRLVAEGYGPGISAGTRLAGWSMAKSVINALVGILVKQGLLQIDSPPPVPEWPPGDPRARIQLDQLLRMTSGLYFEEFYFGPSTATRMLFNSHSTAAVAASQPLREKPGERWYYSSGTSNILSRVIRHRLTGSQADYFSFPRRTLFEPLGMYSAVFEPDPSGTFVGSSFVYATARDWARFGQFYLQDGVWQGRRILPEGWVDYTTRVTPQSPKGRYGAHWWLNRGQPPDSDNRIWPELPADAFFASGFEGQYVLVVPSRELVIVRLGLSHPPAFFSLGGFTRQVLQILGDEAAADVADPAQR